MIGSQGIVVKCTNAAFLCTANWMMVMVVLKDTPPTLRSRDMPLAKVIINNFVQVFGHKGGKSNV